MAVSKLKFINFGTFQYLLDMCGAFKFQDINFDKLNHKHNKKHCPFSSSGTFQPCLGCVWDILGYKICFFWDILEHQQNKKNSESGLEATPFVLKSNQTNQLSQAHSCVF